MGSTAPNRFGAVYAVQSEEKSLLNTNTWTHLRTCSPQNAQPFFWRHSAILEISCKICSPGDSRAAAPTSTASPARRPLQDLTRYVDRPGFLEHSEAQDRSAGGSHEPVSPSMSATPLYNSFPVCAGLGSGRAAEGRRLDAESRAEAPLRHLHDPTRRGKLRSNAGILVSKRPEVSENCALCPTS